MSSSGSAPQENRLSSNSLVATIGLSLFTVWVLLVCFWILGFPENSSGLAISAIERMGAFAGIPIGFLIIGIMAKKPSFNIFNPKLLIAITAMAAIIPSACAAFDATQTLSPWLVFLCLFIGGAAGSFIQVCWLDVFSRFDLSRLGLSIGTATAAGVVVFLLLASMPWYAQDMAASICLVTSVGLVAYTSQIAPGNQEKAPLESVTDRWQFTREVEPSLMLFGMVFALSFFFLLGLQHLWLLVSIGGLAVGALVLMAADLSKHVFRITSVQRVITVITVGACILMPLDSDSLRIGLSIVVAAACSFLVIANSVFLIRKICAPRSVPVFRAIPKRLFVFSAGFALGWILATVIALVPGWDLSILRFIRLGIALLLIATVMIFFPVESHHEDDSATLPSKRPGGIGQARNDTVSQNAAAPKKESHEPAKAAPPGVSARSTSASSFSTDSEMTESEAFEVKCASIAKLYQLSPREAEVLPYLAKGRNNAYLQNKLVISQHTAKSHIYNIYRKLDIHSQQKLMDFVEEFPEDYND